MAVIIDRDFSSADTQGMTFSRSSEATYIDALGVLRVAGNDTPRFKGSPQGLLLEAENSSVLQAMNYNPAASTLIKSGDAAATITVVPDATALQAAGLDVINSGNVYLLDNTAGTTSAYAIVSGPPTDTGGWFYGVYARSVGGSGNIGRAGLPGGAVSFNSTSYGPREFLLDPAVTGNPGRLTMTATAGTRVYFLLFNLRKQNFDASTIRHITPTLTTRSRDICVQSGLSVPTNNIEVVLEFRPQYDYSQVRKENSVLYDLTDAPGNNYIRLTQLATNDVFQLDVNVAGTVATLSTTANDIQFSRNDSLVATIEKTGQGISLHVTGISKISSASASGNFSSPPDRDSISGTYAGANPAFIVVTQSTIAEFEAPTDISLDNNIMAHGTDTAGGVIVGTLSTTDPDSVPPFTYSITGGADSADFSIANDDELFIDDGVLDNTVKNSYEVEVTTEDSEGLTYAETLVVTVSAPASTSLGVLRPVLRTVLRQPNRPAVR